MTSLEQRERDYVPQTVSSREDSSRILSLGGKIVFALSAVLTAAAADRLVHGHTGSHAEAKDDKLSPEALRYRRALVRIIENAAQKWDILDDATINHTGDVIILDLPLPKDDELEQGRTLKSEHGTLFLKRDAKGSVLRLRIDAGKAVTELWPAERDLRETMQTEKATEYHWITEDDVLTGSRSHDGKKRSLRSTRLGTIERYTEADALVKKVSTPQQTFLYQHIFANYEAPLHKDGTLNVPEFIRTFRRSLEEWQNDGFHYGCCNTYAETAAELLDDDGDVYILTYWPQGLLDGENTWGEWHQATGLKRKDDSWVIIDGAMQELQYMSPEEYGKHIGYDLARSPIVGILPYSHPRSPLERFLQHAEK